MKFLSQLCLLLFVVPYLGKQLYPDFFGAWYIQWTSAGLLSLLLPYGFTKSILTKADSKFSGGFLFIFVISVFLNGTGITLLNSTNSFLSVTEQTTLMPENASLEAINNKDPEKRKVVAQFIYKEFGQPITYKDQLGEFIIYKPTTDDKKVFNDRFLSGQEAKDLIENTNQQIYQVIFLLSWSCGCFLIIFMLVFRLEQSKANKSLKQDK